MIISSFVNFLNFPLTFFSYILGFCKKGKTNIITSNEIERVAEPQERVIEEIEQQEEKKIAAKPEK